MSDSVATRPRAEHDEQPDGAAPRLLPGVSLTELDSGAREQTYLLSLPDGRHFQIAGALYQLSILLDGERTHADIAVALERHVGRRMDADEIAAIIDRKLAPLGVLAETDAAGEEPPAADAPRADAALGIFARLTVVPPRLLEPLANAVKYLYAPAVAIPVVVAIALAHLYAYVELVPMLTQLSPATFPLVAFLIGAVCVQLVLPWHELGHAAAARWFGARHGPLGVGLMGPMLVAYVEVTDIWRLPRWQRFVVDLGGVYFQAMSVVVLAIGAWLTGNATFLWIVLFMDLGMLLNLNPLFKLDGYWAFSDATGITNLHQRVGQQIGGGGAGAVVGLARRIGLGRVSGSARLQDMAAQSGQLQGYGVGARIAVVVFSVLFVISLLYFGLTMLVFVPMMLLAYPLLAVQAVLASTMLLSGADPEPTLHIMMLMQFVFATMLLVGVVGMVVQLVRSWRNRGSSTMGGGMGWRQGGASGMGW